MATLAVKGSLDLSQFWPDGSSDADTIKVRVQSDSFLLTTDAGQELPTDVFATAYMNVKGTIKKVVSSTNTVTIRLQGIDAPELHYPPHNYRQYYGKTAAYQLGLELKKYGKPHLDCIVRTDNISSPNDVFDMYGRFVGDVIITESNQNFCINNWLVEQGWAFPAFYATMTPQEIETLTKATITARKKQSGLWSDYSAELVSSMNFLKYQRNEAYSAKDDKGTVHFPKIFRRYCTFLEDNKGAENFGDYLNQKSSRDKFFEVNDFLDKHQSTIKPKV